MLTSPSPSLLALFSSRTGEGTEGRVLYPGDRTKSAGLRTPEVLGLHPGSAPAPAKAPQARDLTSLERLTCQENSHSSQGPLGGLNKTRPNKRLAEHNVSFPAASPPYRSVPRRPGASRSAPCPLGCDPCAGSLKAQGRRAQRDQAAEGRNCGGPGPAGARVAAPTARTAEGAQLRCPGEGPAPTHFPTRPLFWPPSRGRQRAIREPGRRQRAA